MPTSFTPAGGALLALSLLALVLSPMRRVSDYSPAGTAGGV